MVDNISKDEFRRHMIQDETRSVTPTLDERPLPWRIQLCRLLIKVVSLDLMEGRWGPTFHIRPGGLVGRPRCGWHMSLLLFEAKTFGAFLANDPKNFCTGMSQHVCVFFL